MKKRASGPMAKPRTIDEHLVAVSAEKRAALQRLRKDIRAAAPNAEECISYGLPAFRLNGKFLVAFGAASKHCAFYAGSILNTCNKELKGYDTSSGTIRFQPDRPLPRSLVGRLVKARIAQVKK